MPLTAAEQRARRLAEQRRRVSSAQRVDQRSRVSSAQHAARRDDSDSDGADDAFAAEPNEGARSPVASPGGGAGGSRSDSGGIDSDSDNGADDSDSDGADDAFTAEASDDARSPAASPGGSRSDSDNSNDGPGAALADSASHELSDSDAAACSAAYGSAVLRHCQRALQLLHDGGVHASPAAAAAPPDARAGPFPLSDLILQPHAALPSHSCPLLPECGKRACAQACKRWTSSWAPWLASVRPSARGRKSTEGGTPNAPARGSTTLVPLLTCITARTGRICWATLNSLTAPTNLLCSSWRTRSAPQDTSQRRTRSRALKIFESTTT